MCAKPEVNASHMIYGRAHKKERAWRWETQAQGASPMGRAAHCLTLDLPCVCDHIDTSPTFFGAAVGSIGSYLVFVGTQDKSMIHDEWFRYEVVHMRKFVSFASRWCRVEVEAEKSGERVPIPNKRSAGTNTLCNSRQCSCAAAQHRRQAREHDDVVCSVRAEVPRPTLSTTPTLAPPSPRSSTNEFDRGHTTRSAACELACACVSRERRCTNSL